MSEELKGISENELSDELLSEAAGGVKRKDLTRPQLCKGGCGIFTTEPYGYCKSCQALYAKDGIPLIL